MAGDGTDWAAVVERLEVGDRQALYELTRLITGFLARWNAFDFRDDWDDLVQDVLISTARALREGRIRERGAVIGYLRNAARFEFIDRLKARQRMPRDEGAPWEDEIDRGIGMDEEADPVLNRDLESALTRLDEGRRQALLAVYVDGMTYEEAAEALGTRLGTLKRDLREGLGQLRRSLTPQLQRKRVALRLDVKGRPRGA